MKRGLLDGVKSGLAGQAGSLLGVDVGSLLGVEVGIDGGDRWLECKSATDFLLNKLLLGIELGVSDDDFSYALAELLLSLMFVRGVGVREPKLPRWLFPPPAMMLLAGELPGVSTPNELASDRSLLMTVETESLRFLSRASACARSSLISSSMTSTSFISACSRVQRRFISLCNRKISPFAVSRSVTPRSMIARTRSMAGP